MVSRLGNWRLLALALQQSSRPDTFTTADLERYCQARAQPRAYHAMLNWYRATLRKPPSLPAHRPITVPTLLIWGAKDVFLGRELVRPSMDLCQAGQLAMLEEGSHGVHLEELARVNAFIGTFLRGGRR